MTVGLLTDRMSTSHCCISSVCGEHVNKIRELWQCACGDAVQIEAEGKAIFTQSLSMGTNDKLTVTGH